MSKELRRSLKKKVAKLISEDIIDVVLFGSSVKEKLRPNDVDLAVIFRGAVKRETISRFQANLGENYHISALSADQFFTKPHSLAKTLFFEGVSIITGKKISDNFSLDAHILYTYDLTKEKASKKVRFVYLMKGRSVEKGIIKEFNGKYLAPSSFIIPIEKDEEMLKILKDWDIKFFRKKLMLMD